MTDVSSLTCFVIMPYQTAFDPVFAAIRQAVMDAAPDDMIECFSLKEVQAAGRITDDIVRALHGAALCVADMTDNNPNVMWETRYAMALGRPTILVGQSIQRLPFDLKVHRVLEYDPGKLVAFVPALAEAVRQTLARYEIRAEPLPERKSAATGQVVAVTGSMNAHPARTRQRISRMLRPYLSPETVWLCGSNGVTDELAIDFLLEHQQRVAAVGYNQYDLSARVREHVRAGLVQFVDASLESLPKGVAGPTERDTLFLVKSDLVLLFWDGASRGVAGLLDYFRRQDRHVLLAFI